MRLLVLGGTAWLGGCVATTALERGHQVTCLARGSSGPVPAGATFVRADRDRPRAYDEVVREQWDVVVDVSRQPGQVRHAVTALAPRSSSYVFISSGNVYADHSEVGADESSALLRRSPATSCRTWRPTARPRWPASSTCSPPSVPADR